MMNKSLCRVSRTAAVAASVVQRAGFKGLNRFPRVHKKRPKDACGKDADHTATMATTRTSMMASRRCMTVSMT